MTKKMSAKRALISSLLVMAMCFSMLVGSTFAWFTDSVTSAGNIIKSGTLDIALDWADGAAAVPADDSDLWQDASVGAIFNYDLWEPGYVSARHVRIANKGSLALKYKFVIQVNGELEQNAEGHTLADAIDVYYVDPAAQVTGRDSLPEKIGVLSDVLANLEATGSGNLLPGDADKVTIVLKMREEAGNEYQDMELGASFTIRVVATQLASESDSFDNQYDADATYPAFASATAVPNQATVLEAEDITITVPAGDNDNSKYEVEVDNKVVKTAPNGETTVSYDISLLKDGVKVTAGDKEYDVEIEIGEGKAITSVLHNGNPITNYQYADGVLSFKTDSFSPFSYSYDAGVTVFNEAELTAAINEPTIKTIALGCDISIDNILMIGRSVTIKGVGHELSTSVQKRVIRITAANLDVKIYDTVINNKRTSGDDLRGISFDTASAGTKLLLDNCTVSSGYYAINAVIGSDGIQITVKNGTVAAGWAAFNIYSNNATFIVEDSTLRGLNDKGENSWNNFNTITFDGYSLSDAANIGKYGSGNTLSIKNSVVNASSESENIQYWLGIQYGALNNTVTVDSATRIVNDNSEDMSGLFNVGYYCNYNNGSWTYYENGSNSITIGGVEMDF